MGREVDMLAEARQFLGLHAGVMGLRPRQVDAVLGGVTALGGEGRGTWVGEWSRLAGAAAGAGRHKTAASLYNIARFPCADTPARREAARLAASNMRGWLSATGTGEPRSARCAGGDVPFLFRPGRHRDAPLVVIMGGIVSLKEQWGGFLGLVARAGCAAAVVDFPGVGENPVPYTTAASEIFPALMDALAGSCDSGRTLAVAFSFGGHLAFASALTDRRIRGIVTAGAPLRHFFRSPSARAAMPGITRAALCHVTGLPPESLDERLPDFALREADLLALPVPVRYIASLRDEIIPAAEWRDAARLGRQVTVHRFDDVHGSPRHLRQTKIVVAAELLRHAGHARLARYILRAGELTIGLG